MFEKVKRARDIGIPFSGTPGPLNAITDVAGIEVGHVTIEKGEGRLIVGEGPIRTGVTAILPRGRADGRGCFGGSFNLNASGEMTGLGWLEERGQFEGPILLTNTCSLGIVRDTAIRWMLQQGMSFDWTLPIVGETYDGFFNDMNGQHITPDHVLAALDGARGGPVPEGSVGGGTGMMTYEYRGAIGTSSRVLPEEDGGYTVGVLVQSNFGARKSLRIAGIKVGEHLKEDMPRFMEPDMLPDELRQKLSRYPWGFGEPTPNRPDGSVIVIVATDAPLLPHQLRRLAKRPALGLGRLGGAGACRSGDIFFAFSTANGELAGEPGAGGIGLGEEQGEFSQPYQVKMHPNNAVTAIFEAAVDATEEAVLNGIAAAKPGEGANRLRLSAFPHDRIREILKPYNLLTN